MSARKIAPAAATVQGVDASEAQGHITWAQVAQSGRKFAFTKATEGLTITDTHFAYNWASTKALNIYRGAYHFFRARDEGSAQAAHFLKTMGPLNSNDLPPMLDWETLDGHSIATNIAEAQKWLDAVEKATGKVPIIYTDDGTWEALGNPMQFSRYPLYIANVKAVEPMVPACWKNFTFWQYSWTGRVPGIATNCDLDIFNGTEAQLKEFIATGKLPFA